MKRSPHRSVPPRKSLRSQGAKPPPREREEFAGGPLSAGGRSQTWLRSRPAPSGPDPAGTSCGTSRGAGGEPRLCQRPRGQEVVGEGRLLCLPPRRPDFEGWMNIQIISIPASPGFPSLMAYLTCAPAEQKRGCPGPC